MKRIIVTVMVIALLMTSATAWAMPIQVEGGELRAFMAQNPNVMGEDAIDAVVRSERGEDLAGEVVDPGVSTVDASNVADFK